MSMISDLLKTPAEVREEELNKLRTLGQIQAQPLMQMQGKYSAAPSILGNWAGSVAQRLPEQTNKAVRALGGAAGGLADVAQGAGLIDQAKADAVRKATGRVGKSAQEIQAEQTQGIMQDVAGAKDKEAALRQAAVKAFESGNTKLGMALEERADALKEQKRQANLAERQMVVTERGADIQEKSFEETLKQNRFLRNTQGRQLAIQEAAASRDAEVADRNKGLDSVMATVEFDGKDLNKYYTDLSKALSKAGYGKAAQEIASQYKKDGEVDRFKVVDKRLFDTQTRTFVPMPEGEDGEPITFADKKDYEVYGKLMDETDQARETRQRSDTLILDLDNVVREGGGALKLGEDALRDLLGDRDLRQELQVYINQLRSSEAFKALPPGTATEREVELAYKTVPPDGATIQEVRNWLTNVRRLAEQLEAYNMGRMEWIEGKRSQVGLGTASKSIYENSVRAATDVDVREQNVGGASELRNRLNNL